MRNNRTVVRPDDRSRELGLRPETQRFSPIAGVVCLVIAGAVAALGDADARSVAAPLLAVWGVLGLTRFPRMGVTLRQSDMTVRGLMWSRTIPRDRIVDITFWPCVKWIAPSGRTRLTPITVFAFGVLTPYSERQEKHDDRCVDEIRDWLPARRKRPGNPQW